MITLNLKFEEYKDGDKIYSWLKDALIDTFELENAEDIPIKLSKEPNKIISLRVGLPSAKESNNMVINTSNIIDRDSISDNPEEYPNKEVEEGLVAEEAHDNEEESTNIEEHVDDINIIKRDRIGDWCVRLAKEYPDKLDKIRDVLKNHVTEDTTDKALESASQSILGLLYTIYQNHDDIVNDKLTDSDYSSLLTKFDAIIPLFLLILPDLDLNDQEPIDKLFSIPMFKGRYEIIDRDKKVSITSEFEERDIMNNKIKEAFEKRKNADSYDVEDVEVVGNANDSEEAEYNIDTRELTNNAPES